MIANFEIATKKILGGILSLKKFYFEEYREFEGGRKVAVFYKSPLCKLAIYQSQLDGEVNCMIGSTDANNKNMDSDTEWFFLSALWHRSKDLSIEELLARVPSVPKSRDEQLCDIASDLMQNFDELVENLSKQ